MIFVTCGGHDEYWPQYEIKLNETLVEVVHTSLQSEGKLHQLHQVLVFVAVLLPDDNDDSYGDGDDDGDSYGDGNGDGGGKGKLFKFHPNW